MGESVSTDVEPVVTMGAQTIRVVLLGVFTCGIGLLPSGAVAEEKVTRLVYALPVTVPAVIPYVAVDKGFFRDEGLEVEAKMFSSGREALQALLTNHAQLQSVSETPVVHAILQGNQIVIVATVAEHMEAKLIGRTDRGITRPEAVRGKRVATLPGTNSDYFMYRFFEKYGIDPSEVRIANMTPPEMVVAFSNGDIDAYFAWEPHISYGRRQLPDVSVVFYPEELYRGRTTVNMNKEFVQLHPDIVRKVIRGLLAAEAFVHAHQDEALALAAKRLRMDQAILHDLWPEQVATVQLDEGLLPLLIQVGTWAAARSGQHGSLPDFRAYVYPDALQKERPEAVRLDGAS